jgi:hypothetical protein
MTKRRLVFVGLVLAGYFLIEMAGNVSPLAIGTTILIFTTVFDAICQAWTTRIDPPAGDILWHVVRWLGLMPLQGFALLYGTTSLKERAFLGLFCFLLWLVANYFAKQLTDENELPYPFGGR